MMIDESLFQYLQHSIHKTLKASKSNEELRLLLEKIGFSVGHGVIEKLISDQNRMNDEVSVMKFICKEFWLSIFLKQIDNLRTNNLGTFVLQDNNFKLLSHISPEQNNQNEDYLAFSCGLLKGALSNLGYECVITAESNQFPISKFQINILSDRTT